MSSLYGGDWSEESILPLCALIAIRMLAFGWSDLITKMEKSPQSKFLRTSRKGGANPLAEWFARGLARGMVSGLVTLAVSQLDAQSPSDRFTVHTIAPYSIATSPIDPQATLSLNANQIGSLAYRCNGMANLVRSSGVSSTSRISCLRQEEERQQLLDLIRAAAASKLRVETAVQAIKIHYGIAATTQVTELLERTFQELQRQSQAQKALIDAGVSIPDALLIERLKSTWNDQQLENQSKEQTLRLQLSGLIAKSYACSYLPTFERDLSPSDIDVCDYVQRALACRTDLQMISRTRAMLSEDLLSVWDDIVAALTGIPGVGTPAATWITKLRTAVHRRETESELLKRQAWLDCLFQERSKRIQVEVEVAYEKKRTAALRWSNAKQLMEYWDQRVVQLQTLGEENQGNLADLSEARLRRLQSESQLIERWLDWHLADTELKLATGELDFMNAESR